VKQRTEGIPSNHLGDIRKWPTLGCPKMGYATIATCTRSRENSDELRDANFQTNPHKKVNNYIIYDIYVYIESSYIRLR
jgi:hypothetical protein